MFIKSIMYIVRRKRIRKNPLKISKLKAKNRNFERYLSEYQKTTPVTHVLLREAEGFREGWFPGNICYWVVL